MWLDNRHNQAIGARFAPCEYSTSLEIWLPIYNLVDMLTTSAHNQG